MFKRLKREIIYESPWINLIVDQVEYPNGNIIERQHIADILDSAVGIIINENDEILFVKPWRYILDDIGLELPAGMLDPNEEPEMTFVREVKEETNLDITNVEYLFNYYTSNGISNQKVYAYLATCDASKQKVVAQKSEIAELVWLSKQEIKQYIKENKILCGLSLTTLLHYFIFLA